MPTGLPALRPDDDPPRVPPAGAVECPGRLTDSTPGSARGSAVRRVRQPAHPAVTPQEHTAERLGRAQLCGATGTTHDDDDHDEAAPPGFSTPLFRRPDEDGAGADCTPPAGDGSLTARIKNFAKNVFHKAASPLLPVRVTDSSPAKLPWRSRRIAANPLSKYPVAKGGEIIVMQKMGFIESEPTAEGQRRLDELFEGRPGDAQAMRELLFDDTTQGRPRRRHGTGGRA